MSEDETFEALKRIPFEKVRYAARNSEGVSEMIEIIERMGWTWDEYYDEYQIRLRARRTND